MFLLVMVIRDFAEHFVKAFSPSGERTSAFNSFVKSKVDGFFEIAKRQKSFAFQILYRPLFFKKVFNTVWSFFIKIEFFFLPKIKFFEDKFFSICDSHWSPIHRVLFNVYYFLLNLGFFLIPFNGRLSSRDNNFHYGQIKSVYGWDGPIIFYRLYTKKRFLLDFKGLPTTISFIFPCINESYIENPNVVKKMSLIFVISVLRLFITTLFFLRYLISMFLFSAIVSPLIISYFLLLSAFFMLTVCRFLICINVFVVFLLSPLFISYTIVFFFLFLLYLFFTCDIPFYIFSPLSESSIRLANSYSPSPIMFSPTRYQLLEIFTIKCYLSIDFAIIHFVASFIDTVTSYNVWFGFILSPLSFFIKYKFISLSYVVAVLHFFISLVLYLIDFYLYTSSYCYALICYIDDTYNPILWRLIKNGSWVLIDYIYLTSIDIHRNLILFSASPKEFLLEYFESSIYEVEWLISLIQGAETYATLVEYHILFFILGCCIFLILLTVVRINFHIVGIYLFAAFIIIAFFWNLKNLQIQNVNNSSSWLYWFFFNDFTRMVIGIIERLFNKIWVFLDMPNPYRHYCDRYSYIDDYNDALISSSDLNKTQSYLLLALLNSVLEGAWDFNRLELLLNSYFLNFNLNRHSVELLRITRPFDWLGILEASELPISSTHKSFLSYSRILMNCVFLSKVYLLFDIYLMEKNSLLDPISPYLYFYDCPFTDISNINSCRLYISVGTEDLNPSSYCHKPYSFGYLNALVSACMHSLDNVRSLNPVESEVREGVPVFGPYFYKQDFFCRYVLKGSSTNSVISKIPLVVDPFYTSSLATTFKFQCSLKSVSIVSFPVRMCDLFYLVPNSLRDFHYRVVFDNFNSHFKENLGPRWSYPYNCVLHSNTDNPYNHFFDRNVISHDCVATRPIVSLDKQQIIDPHIRVDGYNVPSDLIANRVDIASPKYIEFNHLVAAAFLRVFNDPQTKPLLIESLTTLFNDSPSPEDVDVLIKNLLDLLNIKEDSVIQELMSLDPILCDILFQELLLYYNKSFELANSRDLGSGTILLLFNGRFFTVL